MSLVPPRPVISGEPYAVRQVQGRIPRQLGDFAGETSFLVDVEDESYTVSGPGVETEGYVRVFEKSDGGAGKDVRVWLVQECAGSPEFTATPGGVPGFA